LPAALGESKRPVRSSIAPQAKALRLQAALRGSRTPLGCAHFCSIFLAETPEVIGGTDVETVVGERWSRERPLAEFGTVQNFGFIAGGEDCEFAVVRTHVDAAIRGDR
jgi:hypothetical protein